MMKDRWLKILEYNLFISFVVQFLLFVTYMVAINVTTILSEPFGFMFFVSMLYFIVSFFWYNYEQKNLYRRK